MFGTNGTLVIALAAAFWAAQPAGPKQPAPVPQPQPASAPQAAKTEKLTVKVWSCPEHQQFRMTEKGACPLCGKDLVQREVPVQGTDAVAPYPLDTCLVSGLVLGKLGPPVVMVHEGREVRFCSKECIKKFEAEPAKYLSQIDQKVIEQQMPRYPMTTCPVSGKPLGEMGEPVSQVSNNRLVRFCCKGCLRAFKKSPAEYLPKLDEAVISQQKQGYPLATCMVSGQKLGSIGEPVNYVVANRLVRFCCPNCIGAFYKNPPNTWRSWTRPGPPRAALRRPNRRRAARARKPGLCQDRCAHASLAGSAGAAIMILPFRRKRGPRPRRP